MSHSHTKKKLLQHRLIFLTDSFFICDPPSVSGSLGHKKVIHSHSRRRMGCYTTRVS